MSFMLNLLTRSLAQDPCETHVGLSKQHMNISTTGNLGLAEYVIQTNPKNIKNITKMYLWPKSKM